MRIPEIELLWWEGCPSTSRARNELHAVIKALGLEGAEVRERQIHTDADAANAGFTGSPTILIDGEDVAPEPDEPAGLNCRVYHRRDGRVAPTPDPMTSATRWLEPPRVRR